MYLSIIKEQRYIAKQNAIREKWLFQIECPYVGVSYGEP
jgi:hypothetical protein